MPLQAALWGENTTIHLTDLGDGAWGFMTDCRRRTRRGGDYRGPVDEGSGD